MRKTVSKAGQAQYRLLKGQLSSLILHGQITTTLSRAKYLKSKAEKFISDIGKFDEEFALKRFLAASLYGGAIEKSFDQKGEFKSVAIFKLDKRFGDGAQKAIVRLDLSEGKKLTKVTAKIEKNEKVKK